MAKNPIKVSFSTLIMHNLSNRLCQSEDVAHSTHDQFAEAVLRVRRNAHRTSAAVLAYHEKELPEDDLKIYEGECSETVARALIDSRMIVIFDRLINATASGSRKVLPTVESLNKRKRLSRGQVICLGTPPSSDL